MSLSFYAANDKVIAGNLTSWSYKEGGVMKSVKSKRYCERVQHHEAEYVHSWFRRLPSTTF